MQNLFYYLEISTEELIRQTILTTRDLIKRKTHCVKESVEFCHNPPLFINILICDYNVVKIINKVNTRFNMYTFNNFKLSNIILNRNWITTGLKLLARFPEKPVHICRRLRYKYYQLDVFQPIR